MNDRKDLTEAQKIQIEQDIALSEALIRLEAIEKILIKKGICSRDEINEELRFISESIMSALNNGKIPVSTIESDINSIIEQMNTATAKKPSSNNSN